MSPNARGDRQPTPTRYAPPTRLVNYSAIVPVNFSVIVHKEGEQRVGGAVASRSGVWGRGACERALLEREVGVQVDLGRLETLVAEPERDHGAVHTGLKQQHGGGVA